MTLPSSFGVGTPKTDAPQFAETWLEIGKNFMLQKFPLAKPISLSSQASGRFQQSIPGKTRNSNRSDR